MVWPFSSSSSSDQGTTPKRSSERKRDAPEAPKPQQKPLLLEDTEPRFNNGPSKPELPIKEAVNSISLSDFHFQNLVRIPCFREAALTGLSALGVLGAAVFVAQKSPAKAANWGVGGFLLGSTVAWEQCRSHRRKELAFAQQAKQTVASKEKPMLHKPSETIDEVTAKKREEVKSWWSRS